MTATSPTQANGKMRTGMAALAFAAGMLMMGYAAVPLYRAFCQATGYGGTPRRASEAEAGGTRVLTGKTMSIRFDSNVDADMQWSFHPVQTTQTVTIGQRSLALFEAENLTDHTITGQASYNISPQETASYFNKVQCFCFTRQTLKPHEKVRMPVIFFVDPKILGDKDVQDVRQITLSYTFHIAPKA
ncbi:MAG: cytochrome c oxidase assembly protein [Sphingomonadales bacterium]|nr:cytochrome c oxidase assembly protein [Sphingomonadales bacterium]MDE2169660.1 cytochrome c oxidase assembly protein [Sphingomonadales bacterium]